MLWALPVTDSTDVAFEVVAHRDLRLAKFIQVEVVSQAIAGCDLLVAVPVGRTACFDLANLPGLST